MHLTTRIATGATVIALAVSAPVARADPTRDGSGDDSAKVVATVPTPDSASSKT
jgi:hypothetical protein